MLNVSLIFSVIGKAYRASKERSEKDKSYLFENEIQDQRVVEAVFRIKHLNKKNSLFLFPFLIITAVKVSRYRGFCICNRHP